MKKFFLFLAITMLCAGALATTLTVKFNFPLESGNTDIVQTVQLEQDENAFTVFLQAAAQNSVELDISFFDFDSDGKKESAFINSVNNVSTSEDFSSYWQFSLNNKSAQSGISQVFPAEGDTVSLDYLDGSVEDTLEWIADNQKESGQFGGNLFQSAFGLMALSTAPQHSIVVPLATTDRGKNFILSQQGPDAGFVDELQTAVSTMALISHAITPEEFSVQGKTSTDYLRKKQNSDGGFESGTSESDVDTTSWATLAFVQAGEQLPQNNGKTPVDFLISAQHANGSFGYNAADTSESPDFTSEALIALAAAGHPKDAFVQKSLDWLAVKHGDGECNLDGFRTALSGIAFQEFGETQRAENALECLTAMQNGDGSFGRSTNRSNAMDTALAAIALGGNGIPLTILPPQTGDQSGSVGLNSILKFSITIQNIGEVDAKNVNISLQGIPQEWILGKDHGSVDHFDKIEPNETKTAEIFAIAKGIGSFDVSARVVSETLVEQATSNEVSVKVNEAGLKVTLTVAGR